MTGPRDEPDDDAEFQEILARTLAGLGDTDAIRNALLYVASICPCRCHETGNPEDCPTGFCTYGSRLCASEMNARLYPHADTRGIAVLPSPPGVLTCCGEMVSIGTGHVGSSFDIEVWRCLNCGWHKSRVERVDGGKFWVGEMGRAIRREELRIIAAS